MPRVALSGTLFSIAFLISLSASAQSTAPKGLDVLYLWQNYQQLIAYDIDSEGQPTQVGQPLPLGNDVLGLTTDRDGHFLYTVRAAVSGQLSAISVYATHATGAPRLKPTQQTNFRDNVEGIQISPNPRFAYVIGEISAVGGLPIFQIRLFDVDRKTGRLGDTSKLEYTSQLDGPCGTGWSDLGWMFFDGFSADGSTLYTGWYCSSHGGAGGFNYAYSVNPHTGELGQPHQVFAWASNEGSDFMWFTPKVAIDVGDPGYSQGLGWVNIYPPGGGSNMIFSCTAQMLEGCGYGGVPNPSGEYIFLGTSSSGTDVGKIEIPQKQIIDTGNTAPYPFLALSPDQHLVYTENPSPLSVTIYTFNLQNGALQQGGTIPLPSQTFQILPAVRR